MSESKTTVVIEAVDRTRQGIESASGNLKRMRGEVDTLSATIGRLGPLLGVAGAAGLFGKFVTETINAQNAQAQLSAVLKSTAEAAGFNAQQLNLMAAAMSEQSIFGADEITSAQTRLLSYTGIVGTQFPAAMQAVIDMATRMGMSLEQSSETVGRALDIPSQGLTALTRQGFRFTEEQKSLIIELENTGRVGEAQAIMLKTLESSYGGAAAAAKNSLGGALAGLREDFNDLFEMGSSGRTLAKVINSLGDNLVTLLQVAGAVAVLFAGRMVGGLSASAVAFTKATMEAARYQATLASMAGVSKSGAIATGLLRGSISLLGGPIGIATTLFVGLGFALKKMSDEIEDRLFPNMESLKERMEQMKTLAAAGIASTDPLAAQKLAIDQANTSVENALKNLEELRKKHEWFQSTGNEWGAGNVYKEMIEAGLKYRAALDLQTEATENLAKAQDDSRDSREREGQSFEVLTADLKILARQKQEFAEQSRKITEAGQKEGKTQAEIGDAIEALRVKMFGAAKTTVEANDRAADLAKTYADLYTKAIDLNRPQEDQIETLQRLINEFTGADEAARKFVQTQIELARERERLIASTKAWEEQDQLNRGSDDREQSGIEERAQADEAAAQQREAAFGDMAERLERENEDLNIALIADDKKRARAQLDIEHERAKLAIDALMLEADERERLHELEDAQYEKQIRLLDQQKSLARDIGLTFSSAFEDAIVGGDKFSDILKGIEQDIIRILARRTITEPLMRGFDSILGSLLPSANGNAFTSSGVHAFANGGAFGDGEVLTQPTFFRFASGGAFRTGVAGEAGDEAALPLKRLSNGKLGVHADVSGGSSVMVKVTVDASGSKVEGNDKAATQLGDAVGAAVRAELIKQMRPAGLLARH